MILARCYSPATAEQAGIEITEKDVEKRFGKVGERELDADRGMLAAGLRRVFDSDPHETGKHPALRLVGMGQQEAREQVGVGRIKKMRLVVQVPRPGGIIMPLFLHEYRAREFSHGKCPEPVGNTGGGFAPLEFFRDHAHLVVVATAFAFFIFRACLGMGDLLKHFHAPGKFLRTGVGSKFTAACLGDGELQLFLQHPLAPGYPRLEGKHFSPIKVQSGNFNETQHDRAPG